MNQKLVSIRKRGGLQGIKTSTGTLRPRLFTQKVKDENSDGDLVGDYKDPTFPGAAQFYTPSWDSHKGRWSWGGDEASLTDLIERCRLKEYLGKDRGFPKYGDYIKPEKVAHRLVDMNDSFFRHPTLWTTIKFEGGRFNFDLNNPIHKALYIMAKGDRYVADKAKKEGRVSKYTKADWKYELVESDVEIIRKVEEAEKDINAIEVFVAIKNDTEKLHKIALIMQLPGYKSTMPDHAVMLLVKDLGAENNAANPKFGGMTNQDKFLELAQMDDTTLEVQAKIITGLRRGRIRRDGLKGYTMNGKQLHGVRNESMLIDYFLNDDNVEDFIDLVNWLEAFENRGK